MIISLKENLNLLLGFIDLTTKINLHLLQNDYNLVNFDSFINLASTIKFRFSE